VALIFVDAAGENSIAVASGANACLSPDDVQQARQAIEAADVVLLQLETPLETVLAAAQMAHQAGARVILNPAPAPADPLPAELLACVDILTPNESELALLAGSQASVGQAAARVLGQGVETVIVTLGAQGALIVTRDTEQTVPSFSVDAVDTTAAGDAFNGGLAVALAEEKELTEAVQFANVCGALATTRLGAQPSLPTRGELAAFLSR
jgi:ribokinase